MRGKWGRLSSATDLLAKQWDIQNQQLTPSPSRKHALRACPEGDVRGRGVMLLCCHTAPNRRLSAALLPAWLAPQRVCATSSKSQSSQPAGRPSWQVGHWQLLQCQVVQKPRAKDGGVQTALHNPPCTPFKTATESLSQALSKL